MQRTKSGQQKHSVGLQVMEEAAALICSHLGSEPAVLWTLEKVHSFCSADGELEYCHVPNYCNPAPSSSPKKKVKHFNTNLCARNKHSVCVGGEKKKARKR